MYVLGLLTSLGMAVYKCQVMGLLPTHPSDWLAFVEPQMVRLTGQWRSSIQTNLYLLPIYYIPYFL